MAFSYYHWPLRHYVFISLDGQVAVQPGDGKWILHAPHGEYRGWMRGAVRAIAQPWLMRHFALRDWARFNERHGLPILKGKVPAGADAQARNLFEAQIAALGSDTAMILPQGVQEQFSYDLELLEAQAGEWESFKAEIDQCDMQIVLTLLYQNLTTEVQEGSFAAARVHAAVRQAALKADSRALAMTIYHQIARPFAAFNFGDPDLAPWTEWEVTPAEDFNANADVLVKWANALKVLRDAGYKVLDKESLEDFAQTFGFKMPDFEIVEPVSPAGAPVGPNAEPKGTSPGKPTESQRKPAGEGE
jgi:phage gp29-like protein